MSRLVNDPDKHSYCCNRYQVNTWKSIGSNDTITERTENKTTAQNAPAGCGKTIFVIDKFVCSGGLGWGACVKQRRKVERKSTGLFCTFGVFILSVDSVKKQF